MANASGASVGISYVAETTVGTTPDTPTMLELRTTSRNINPVKNPLQSAERRSNRQIQDFRHGFRQVNGSLGFELGMTDYDAMIEGFMAGNRTTGVATGTTTLNSVNATSKFTRASGSFVTDGFKVGDWVATTAMGQSGNFRITALSATDMTVTPAPVDDTGDADEAIAVVGRTMDIGSVLKAFTFERRFTDITQYQQFAGCVINSAAVSIQPDAIATVSLDILGMSFVNMSGTSLGSPTAASYTSPFSAFDGSLYVQGSELTIVTGVDFTVNNGRTLQGVVGQTTSADVFEGTNNISGTISFLLTDAAMVSYFEDETEIELGIKLDDIGGTDFHAIHMARVKINAADIDPPQEGPVIVTAPFQALYSATAGSTMRWQISNAA